MSNPLRSVFAIFFGFMVMFVAVIPLTLIAVKLFGLQSGHPTSGYLLYNVAANLIAAFFGGLVTGLVAVTQRVRHGIALATLLLVMAALSYLHYRGQQPLWYQLLLIAVPPCFVVLGAFAADRRAKP
jgi:hypothetical protein